MLTHAEKIFLGMIILTVVVSGCGGGGSTSVPTINTTRSIEAIQAEAGSMSEVDLKKTVQSYEKVIAAKGKEIEKATASLKELPPKEVFGEQARTITSKIAEIRKEISELKKRVDVYAEHLK
jgi:hypothetical protein